MINKAKNDPEHIFDFFRLQPEKRRLLIRIMVSLLIALFAISPLTAMAAETTPDKNKTVRVGWYVSSFNRMDEFGRRSGYAYEYQQRIAAYTGWNYEYVEGSWPELLDMLKKGQIDLMSDVSYTTEREKEMLFPSFPMGAEAYYLFITPENTEIKPGQYSLLNGKKVGINKGSIQEDLFLEWEKENNVSAEIVQLTGTEDESLQLLTDGAIDAYLTLDANGDINQCVPIIKIGQSDYYFAVNKERPDLLVDLNYALSRIQDQDKYYNQGLYEKYTQSAGANAFLIADETNWLDAHGSVKVGYVDNYLPFCATDPRTGSLTGALNEYLSLAKDCTQNAAIDFETKSYHTTEDALSALAAGEVDCVFPVSMTAYDCEERGILVTSSIMQTEMYACIRNTDRAALSKDSHLTVATIKGFINDDLFVKNTFPLWNAIEFETAADCFKSVYAKSADVTLISGYRVALTEELREKYNLLALTTGASMPFSFAVRKDDIDLFSLLDKTVNLVPVAMIEASLAANSSPNEDMTLAQYFKKHMTAVIPVVIALSILATVFQIRRTRRMKKELEERLALQEKVISQEREKHESDEMINAMASDYRSVYYVDLDKDSAICYRANTELKGGLHEGDHFTFSERFTKYAQDYVVEADREGFLDFIRPENIRKALKKETLISYRYLVNWDGMEQYELLRMASVGNNAEEGDGFIRAVGVGFTDVDSETRKELEKNAALSDALNQAEAANAAKTAFLSSMSHEIRTPMNAIIGFNDIALKDPGLTDNVKDCLEKIGSSADHLLHLINNILDMSRIESGRMMIRNEEFSFRSMLEQINAMIDGQCHEKGLTYKCEIIGQIDDYYIGDDTKLKQVLLNILGNSVKYTPAPGTVSFCVEPLHKFDDNVSLRFVIKDTGIGMDKEFLPKVFTAFTQEDEAKVNKYGSTGLGMAIAKNIVEMMNGNIEVDSEKGKGTTFTVTVTLRICDKRAYPEGSEIRPQDMHVLIIDDDEDALKAAKAVLDEVGINSDTCSSGREAYEMLKLEDARHEAYNLILVDWKIPDEDGVEITRKIRRKYKDHTAIIILTAYNWEEIEEEALDAGVDSFMTKPLFASSVLSELSNAISNRKYDAPKQEKADLNGRHILIAEDMMINAEIIKRLLSSNGMEVDHAVNGQEAVDMFKNSPEGNYDAILMDIRMPVLDGLGAAEAIRNLDRSDAKNVPIIAMTANAFDEDVQRSLQAGMNAHLSKPIETERLFETLETLIDA